MNKVKIFRKYTFNRIFEIISGCILIIFGLGSILQNPSDSLNQKCSFISSFIGIFLFLYGLFYKIEVTNEAIVFTCLIPFKRISLMNVSNLKVEKEGKNFHILFEYSNGKKQRLSNIGNIEFRDCLIEDIENIIDKKEQDICNVKKLEQRKIHSRLLIKQIAFIFAILLNLIIAGIITYFFINLIKRTGVVENSILVNICVIGVFSITFLLFFELIFFFIRKRK